MTNNKELWNRAFTTDPKAVKAITGKQYSGNSPKPYWIVERLTDEFGPCGIGWGFTILNERFERFSDTDTLHVAVVRFWYMLGEKRGELEQVGQTKSSYTTSKGVFLLDEDAPKKSVTDALVKCASYLGFAGDIFSGRWDDSRYVAEANKEWRAREKASNEPKQEGAVIPADFRASPTDGAGDGLTDAARTECEELAAYMVECHQAQNDITAIGVWYASETWPDDVGEKQERQKYVWHLLKSESKLRGIVKANAPTKAAA
jgi:hypothetical protein